jgi:hypothetical protein
MSDKPVDKTAFVLHRMYPASGLFSDAKKVSEEWLEFLKKMNGKKVLMLYVFKKIKWHGLRSGKIEYLLTSLMKNILPMLIFWAACRPAPKNSLPVSCIEK